jgi:hypothetical protein
MGGGVLDRSTLIDGLYQKLANEEDARVCRDISEEACREVPGNFFRLLLAHFFTKLGDAIASPKTVLAWVTNAVGAPAIVLGFLVPIRESGSLIPQLFIAGYVRRLPVRKWVWVIGSVVQALAVAGLGIVAVTLRGDAAGGAILLLLVLFSLARGFCSVASKDVLGKSVPKTRRGRLTGWAASAAGLVTLGVGIALMLPSVEAKGQVGFGWLLGLGGAMWILGAVVYAGVEEFAGETGGGANAVTEALARLSILREDAAFRRFVISRALLMCSALSAPYYVALGQERLGEVSWLLGLFVVAGGLANLVSAPFWGHFADRSSRWVMVAAALVTSVTGFALVGADRFLPQVAQMRWFVPGMYFLLSLAHSGVRVGRKTYVVDLASGNRRTDYVAVSNTVIGVLLLAAGGIGSLAPLISHAGIIAVLSSMGLLGAVLSATLPDTTE